MLQWVKVARYSFSGSIPPNFEHKFNRQKQRFGKIVTTILLDEDENLLWSGLQWHRSCRSNEMTKLPLLLAAVFIGTGSCNYPLTIFCAIRINITWQWRHNSFSSKPNSCPYPCPYVTYTLGACLLLCKVSWKSVPGILSYFWISTKRV